MAQEDLPKVGIVILNWNGKAVSSECLDSLKKTKYPNLEIYLVDNASTDGSQKHFKTNYPWVILIENGENLGFTGGNNKGIREALKRGANYILLLNNDTIVAPDFLNELVKAGQKRGDVGILCPKIYYYDYPDMLWYAGGNISLFRGIPKHFGFQKKDNRKYDQEYEVNFITGCAFLIKREVIEKIGLLDENLFIYSEDSDWSLRALKAGYKGLYVPSSKIWHKEGIDSKKNRGNDFRMYLGTRNIMYVMYKHTSSVQFVLFLVYFFINWMLSHTVKRTLKGEFKILLSIWKGFFEFWDMKRKINAVANEHR